MEVERYLSDKQDCLSSDLLSSPTDGYAIVQRPGTKQNVPEASEVPTEVPEEDRGEDRGEMLMLIYDTNVAWEPIWFLRLITPTL